MLLLNKRHLHTHKNARLGFFVVAFVSQSRVMSSVVKRENSNICLELNFRSLSTLKHNGYAAATARPIFLDNIDRLDSKISQLKDKLLRHLAGRIGTVIPLYGIYYS